VTGTPEDAGSRSRGILSRDSSPTTEPSVQLAKLRPDRPVKAGGTSPNMLAEIGLETEETRDTLLRARKESRLELGRSLGSSAFAGLAIGIESWGVVRGEPFFGWLIPVLFTAFAVYFWSRRRRAESHVASLEQRLEVLEAEREGLANRTGSRSESFLSGGLLEHPDEPGFA